MPWTDCSGRTRDCGAQSLDPSPPQCRAPCVTLALLLLLSLLLGVSESHDAQSTPPSLADWLEAMLGGHPARVRPVRDWRTPTLVTIDFSVLAVLDVEEKHEKLLLYILYTQVWKDEYLSWDPSQFQGVRRVSVPVQDLWVPDIIVYEMAGLDGPPRSSLLSVSHRGQVEQRQPRLLVSSCPLDLHAFPLDWHTCNLTFSPLSHTKDEVQVRFSPLFVEVNSNWDSSFARGEWELVSLSVLGHLPPLPPSNTSAVRVQVTVRRRPLLYLVTLLLPSALLLLLDGLAFFIPPYYKQRLSVKTAIFTGHFIFLLMVFSLFPPFRGQLPLIEVYLIGSLGLLACSTMETAVIFQTSNGRCKWAEKYIFPYLSQLLRIGRWEEPSAKGPAEEVMAGAGDEGRLEGSKGAAVGQRQLAGLRRELGRVRSELENMRRGQDRLSLSRELGTALDSTYLYLHCFTLLLGGALLYTMWPWRL